MHLTLLLITSLLSITTAQKFTSTIPATVAPYATDVIGWSQDKAANPDGYNLFLTNSKEINQKVESNNTAGSFVWQSSDSLCSGQVWSIVLSDQKTVSQDHMTFQCTATGTQTATAAPTGTLTANKTAGTFSPSTTSLDIVGKVTSAIDSVFGQSGSAVDVQPAWGLVGGGMAMVLGLGAI